MKTSVNTAGESLQPAQDAGWGVKIGGEHGGGSEKLGVVLRIGLQNRIWGRKSRKRPETLNSHHEHQVKWEIPGQMENPGLYHEQQVKGESSDNIFGSLATEQRSTKTAQKGNITACFIPSDFNPENKTHEHFIPKPSSDCHDRNPLHFDCDGWQCSNKQW
jgi:hypothetical protein